MTNHTVYLLKPGVTNISGTAARDTDTLTDIDYIKCDFETFSYKASDKFKLKRRPKKKNTIIGLENIDATLVFSKWVLGAMPGNTTTKRIWKTLNYILGAWKRITGVSNSKMSKLYWFDGTIENLDRQINESVAPYTSIPLYGVMRSFEITENFANNMVIKNMTLDIVFP